MATINFATREISAKLVYFGASGAGCNTNLERLHALLDVKGKSALHRFGPGDSDERSSFFEYRSPDAGPVDSFVLALSVYSLPGGILVPAHRDEVLRDVDGVVFVADARVDRNPANVEALLALETELGSLRLDISDLPFVIQVNHVDADEARGIDDVVFDLNPFGFTVIPAVARRDEGVVTTHHEVVGALASRIGNAVAGLLPGLRLTAVHDPNRPTDAEIVRAHIESIAIRAAATPERDEVVDAPPPEDPAELAARIEALPTGPTVTLAFQPRELVGSHPAQVLGAEVHGDQVHVELLMERMGGLEQRRMRIVLQNRPSDSEPVARVRARSGSPVGPAQAPDGHAGEEGEDEEDSVGAVFDYLPEDDGPIVPVEEPPEDLPGVWYGVLGAASGVLIGLLSAYLVGAAG